MTENQYAPAEEHGKPTSFNRNKWLALALLTAPFVLAEPLRYWALNHAGGWFVSTDLDAEHRRVWLGFMYLALIASLGVWCFFCAAILL